MRAPVPLVAMTMLAALTRGQEPGERRPEFPAGVELVTVDVVVIDREGAPVRACARGLRPRRGRTAAGARGFRGG